MLDKLTNKLNEENPRALVILFTVFWVLAFLFYYNATNSQLIDDGFAGLIKLKTQGWKAFARSFGFPSMYYVHDIVVLGTYMVVGKSSVGWFTIMFTLHCINATLVFVVFARFYRVLQINHAVAIALTGALMFLLSPYQTENVLWAATMHYSVSLLLFLFGALLILKTGAEMTASVLLKLAVILSIALLTLEISLVFPFAWLCIHMAVLIKKGNIKVVLQKSLQLLLPMIAVIVLYFITTRIVKGHWIPHYGTTHLENNTLSNYSTSVARYIVKLLGYVHFGDYKYRDMVYSFCIRWKVVLCLQLGFVALIATLLTLTKRYMALLAFVAVTAMSVILIFPSLQMYFMYLFTPENDRLSYFFSIALYQGLALLLLQLPAIIGYALLAGYMSIGSYYLYTQVDKWHDAGVLHARCIDSFVWTTAPKVYMLNSPANYRGVYQFRNNGRLPYALDFYKDYTDSGKIVHVLSSSFGSLNDSTVVTIENDTTLNVKFITNGGWLMNEFLGATDYKTPAFSVDVNEWEPSYRVVFHTKDTGAVYVGCSGNGYYQIKGF